MTMYEIISKKRDKLSLTKEEIEFFVKGIVNKEIPDYQISALLMAIYLNGMNDEETSLLTDSMANSGDLVDLSGINGLKLDKHSTGGVGDKTTLIIGPMLASLGEKIAKMSGKGLGFTGGTIDKLQSIPGYKTEISKEDFTRQVNDINIAVISQSGNIAPADKLIYALRDVTATVESIPLISSSIMSKKIASGANNILLDVKVGSGAFMKNINDARILATTMVNIGKHLNRKMTAMITSMDEPLGNAIGNSLEVIEAIEVLKGRGPEDLKNLSIEIVANMLMDSKKISKEEANNMAINSITSGSALNKLKELIKYQGGNIDIIDNYNLFPISLYKKDIISNTKGYITKIDTEAIGLLSSRLGAGRITKEDSIDYGAGIIIHKKINDYIIIGDVIASYYTSKDIDISSDYLKVLTIQNEIINTNPLIIEVIK